MAKHKVGTSDIWALAKVIEVAYANFDHGNIPRELLVWTKRMINPDPSKRPTAEQILRGCPLFRQAFLRELIALDELSATSMDDQVAFYEKLAQATKRDIDGVETTGSLDEVLWRGCCIFKLLPKLAATLKIALASHFEEDTRRKVVQATLPLVVQVAAMLSDTGSSSKSVILSQNHSKEELIQEAHAEKLKSQLVAALESVLILKDAKIRLQALRHMDRLAPLLKSEYVNKKLFEAVLLGFADDDDGHRLQTLMAMLQIAPKLSDKNRHDRLLRVVKRLETDRSAKIRTNVIIFYGKLAPDLPDALRLKAALPAFLKALEDQSSYVRLAAVRALGACRDHFTATVAAKGIIPNVAPLLLDPSGSVRQAASPCVDAFLSSVRSSAEKMAQLDAERAKQKQQIPSDGSSNTTQKTQPETTEHTMQAPDTLPKNHTTGTAATGWASWALGKVVDTAKHAVEAEFNKPTTIEKEVSMDTTDPVHENKQPDGWNDQGWGDLDEEEPKPVETPANDAKAERERKIAARRAEMVAKRQQKTKVKPSKNSTQDDAFFTSFESKDTSSATARTPAVHDLSEGDWNDDGWGDLNDEEPKPVIPKTNDAKTEREHKLAARRAEAEAKRAQKATATVPPPAPPTSLNNDGWDDLDDAPPKAIAPAPKAERERKIAARRAEMEAKRQQRTRVKSDSTAPTTVPTAAPNKQTVKTLSLKKSGGPSRQQKMKKIENAALPVATRLEIDENETWDDF
eukprot:CAMPEP_0197302618 /NCGR_PEP_ID=MMETSP0890-20130614/51163_1 /TAXON_ID=44058 ORGANISM="Aureoumbra lagunensis, Strain CCMP1510" /NCGR_SAMPLE_ID=MMETSP0890 /ASSEMBLY_ACC=CAM_ASM_000533 /LENGTH=741 /DNA_ID=CAMNT_0042782273 /DNA_START=356 /DNA_END=2581 /DNA_ORIENTATION=+